MMPGALEGLRVLDLSELVAGAYCGKLLGAYGAEVIKVEPPGGERARREGPFLQNVPNPETSALFSYLNTNKRGVTLNLRNKRGQAMLRDLLKQSDILVENYGPDFLPKLGLDPSALLEWNPRLISVSISYFGERGPYVRYRGTSLVAYAMGGYLYLTGEPGREPLQGPGPQPEYAAGLHGTIGAIAALFWREQTGLGRHVEVPIFEVMVSLHQFTITRYTYNGDIQKRTGNRCGYPQHPQTIYACRDGYVATAVATEEMGQRMLQMMEMGKLLEDERFATGALRLLNADAFDAMVEPWFLARSKYEVFQMCLEWRVPCGLVSTAEDLLRDPHHIARDFWVQIEHPVAGTVSFPGAPFRMSETPWQAGRAPLVGEHNQLIYGQRLGLKEADLAQLRLEGVI